MRTELRPDAMRSGVTVVEVLMIVLVIVVLLALFLPWNRGVPREMARRMQCIDNLRQISMGVQGSVHALQRWPAGAKHRISDREDQRASWGRSWLATIEPYCKFGPILKPLSPDEKAAAENDYLSPTVRASAHGVKTKQLLCPSSPLPTMQTLGKFELTVPSYVGIMGANELVANNPQEARDIQQRIVAGPYGGYAAGNGFLLINQSLTYDKFADGTSNIIAIGEVSSWYFDGRQKRSLALSIADAGDGFHNEAGWIAGTNVPDRIERDGPAIKANRVLNLVTIEHAINTNNRTGKQPKWGTQGIGRCGLNNPLISAHPGGVVVAFADGSTRFLSDTTDLYVLKRLAIRDDGGVIPNDY